MMFFNNPQAAGAILQDRRDRLQPQLASERGTASAPSNRRRGIVPQLQEKPAPRPAAAA